MNTPLKALRAGPGAGRLQSHRKWRGTQENGSQRQARSRALGTAARRAPLQAAGLPRWVGKRERAAPVRARRRQGWKPEGERPKGSLRSTTARPGRRSGDALPFPPQQLVIQATVTRPVVSEEKSHLMERSIRLPQTEEKFI
jgi:hypothetical protein